LYDKFVITKVIESLCFLINSKLMIILLELIV